MTLLSRSPLSPEALLISSGSEWFSLAEITDRVETRARVLREVRESSSANGLVHTFEVEPDVEGVVELLATWRAGFIAAPLNPRLSEAARDEARKSLAIGNPPEGTCSILWTSGTSGRPRGVALSWENFEANAHGSAARLSLCRDDVWMASLSLAHIGGLALITRSILIGNRLLAPGKFNVSETVTLLEDEEGPTHMSLVPTQLHRLLDEWGTRSKPQRLKCVLVGGAHAPLGLVNRAVDSGWPIALTYGATEMSSQIATAGPEEVRAGRRDVGCPLQGVEVRVSHDGELMTRGATRALGYVGNEVEKLADGEGWYRTGDMGVIEEGGRLSITGRRIDRIVTGGVTIDAIEVEERLRLHPAVTDICVVGVPDEVWGERVAAWIEPVVSNLDLDEFESWVANEMSAASRPRMWKVGDVLPRNANGKVDRARVRSAF